LLATYKKHNYPLLFSFHSNLCIFPVNGTTAGLANSSLHLQISVGICVKAVDPFKKILLLSSGQFPRIAEKIARTTSMAGNAS